MNDIPNYNDYLGQNEDWSEFNKTVSDNTGNRYKEMWLQNLKGNKERVKKQGWAAPYLQDIHEGKTAIILGASPAIKKQVSILQSLQDDPEFVLIGITSGLKWLLDNDIKPKYCMIADADPAMVRFWEDLDMSKTKDILLISNVLTSPEMLDKWQGDIKFLAIYTAIKEMDRKFEKWYRPVNGCGVLFAGLCSQYNEGVAFARLVMGCKILIFVGNELSFPSNDAEKAPYYVDGKKDVKDSWLRKPHPDIYGNVAYTNYMFMSLKLSLEDFLGKISGDGWYFNATEAGIFGVSNRFGNLPWIVQMKLPMAIMQARSIMRTGNPILNNFLIQKPSLSETFVYGGNNHVRLQ